MDVRGAAADRALQDGVDELDDRRLVVGAEVGDVVDRGGEVDLASLSSAVVGEVRDVVAELDAQAVDVVVGGDDRAHRHAGDHRDVVDRQHVGRVGHGQQELPVVVLADRDRVVAAHEARVDQARQVGVDLEDREVDALDAEPLGQHARQLLRRQDAVLDQHAAGEAAGLAGVHHRALDVLLLREPELDDDLADEPRRPPARHRRDQPEDVGDRVMLRRRPGTSWRRAVRAGRRDRHTRYVGCSSTRVQRMDGCSVRPRTRLGPRAVRARRRSSGRPRAGRRPGGRARRRPAGRSRRRGRR